MMEPTVPRSIENDGGRFNGGETHEKSAGAMLNELGRWTEALRTLRKS